MSARLEVEQAGFLADLRAASVPKARFASQARQRDLADKVLAGMRMPTIKDEAWRFTPLGPLTEQSYDTASCEPPPVLTADIGRFLMPEAENTRLVFLNGAYSPHLSSVKDLPAGLVLAPLSLAPADLDEMLTRHLGLHCPPDRDVFTALNTRLWCEGAMIVVPAGLRCPQPLHVMFVATSGIAPHVASPRILAVLGKHAEVTLVEEYVCLDEGVYLTNAVAELELGANAVLRHTRVQSESRSAFHIANATVTLGRDAQYHSQAVALGARISRYSLDVVQTDTGSQATVDGLALIAGHQEADTHTTLDHAKPHGQSRQLHKCIVADDAHAVFNGRVVVRKDAQQTDSAQASRNLLLSDRARVDTKPELEIFADDVKCAHGAAIGQIDADELFYLKSRGLDEVRARDLLTYAFAAEVIDRVPVASLRRQLRAVVMKQTDRKAGTP
ncbi:MAG: Iron-regulated transporter permease protein SufD [Cyanobacteria bacterium RYN_339]|nr:Iron-regulated transporter permease protein SufD [Cyanobacteria bacterium RYN_339]